MVLTRILGAAAIFTMATGLSAETPQQRYEVGQVWEYKARAQDAGSLLKIQRVSHVGNETVYHLSVIGVRFQRRDIAGVLPHMPVSKATLDASVSKQTSIGAIFPTSAVDDGIAEWQSAQGGVFTIPVSEIIDIVDQQMSQAEVAQDRAH